MDALCRAVLERRFPLSFSIFDAHTHLGPAPKFPWVDWTSAGLIRRMDRLGIDRAAVSSLPGIFGQTRWGNEQVAQAQKQYPHRIIGYMTSDPGDPDTIETELEYAYGLGLRAMKIYSYSFVPGLDYDHPNYAPIYAFANRHRMPVLVHTWGAEMDQLQEAFRQYPDIRWLCAHVGSRDLDKYVDSALKFPNVNLELCYSKCPKGLVEYLVREVPVEQIVWGSDQAFFDAAHQLGRVVFAEVPEAAKHAILSGNAERIFSTL
ncbi:MAG: amidohydrolase [Opitutales bacterium]|nr:amidohydrolase [Opitutales bacterium]